VQGEQDAVRTLGFDVEGDPPHHLVENGVLHRPGRRGPGHDGWDQLVAEPVGPFDEPGELVVGVFPDGDDVRTERERPLDEPPAVGRGGGEGVRLVHQAGDEDAHG
jgi:hypothetical protein